MAQQSSCPVVKICGISRGEDIAILNQCLPEYVGFVFHQQSSRYVDLSTAGQLRAMLDPRILSVGVFVDAPVDQIVAAAQSGAISIVQLHGQETPTYVASLREALGAVPIINAWPIVDGDSFAYAMNVDPDYLLFDGPQGGSGQQMDWSLLDDIRHYTDMPGFFLAGGLTVDNVQAAMSLGVDGVDVSTGVETGGVKDPAKIHQFISTVRGVHDPRSTS
jgi:phosphoribosylanthranilate isomerase